MQSERYRTGNGTHQLIAALAIWPVLMACITPAAEATPAPSPTPTPVVTAAPTPAPPPPAAPLPVTPSAGNWMDAPQTPGDWTYVAEPTATLAVFGTGRTPETVELIIRCDLDTRRVGIARRGSAAGPVEMLVRTETQDRTLTGTPLESASPLIASELAAHDSLLDAIAFSKGRFAIETAVTPPLFAPAWPEITRVMEDCRS